MQHVTTLITIYLSRKALMKQIGAEEWARLTEKERQARLMKLKLQERRLRQEGKSEEAYALLGQGIQNQEGNGLEQNIVDVQ